MGEGAMAPAHRNRQRYDRWRTIPQSILLRTYEVPMIRALLSFAFATLCAYLVPSGLASAADSREAAAPRRIGVFSTPLPRKRSFVYT